MEKNHKSKKTILIAVFFAVLILPSVLWLAFGETVTGSTEVLEEKREPAAFPKEISDGFFAQIGAWYSDRAPYRSAIIKDYSVVMMKPDYRYREGLRKVYASRFVPEWYRQTGSSEPYCLPFIKNEVIYGRNDWLFYDGEGSTDFYLGNNLLSDVDLQDWKETYQELQAECDKKGIKLVIMIAPDKEQVYPEEMPSLRVVSDKKRAELLEEYMKDSGVTFLYPLREMTAANENGETYYRQDTHWDDYGAYVAVKEINDALGNEMPDAADAGIIKSNYIGGDLSEMSGFESEYEIASVEYKPEVKVESKTSDKGYFEKHFTNADTDAKLVMISDSFRVTPEKYLVKDYKESTVAHRRMYKSKKLKKAIKNLKEGDVLLFLAAERYDLDNVGAAESVIKTLRE